MSPDDRAPTDARGDSVSPDQVFISERECEICRKAHESTMSAIQASLNFMTEGRERDSERISAIDTKVDLLAADVRTVKETLAERRQDTNTIVRLVIKFLPYILLALGIGGGVAYKGSSSPDPVQIQQVVEDTLKALDRQP